VDAGATTKVFASVAVEAQHLKPRWVVVLPKVRTDVSSNLSTMFSPILVDVVNGQELQLVLTTTSTTTA